MIARRPKRVLPIDYGPPTDPHDGPGEPLVESVWVEPYPDETLGLEDGFAAPEARYEQRESVELAFIAALQHLPANQRAVLILREVLGFSAREVAESLETTVASVNSALQRARKTVDERLPEQSQQATLRALGDERRARARRGLHRRVGPRRRRRRSSRCWPRTPRFAMPPLRAGSAAARRSPRFLGVGPLSGEWRWRHVLVRANGQPALAFYSWDEASGAYLPFALNVLTLRDGLISDVTAFIARVDGVPRPRRLRALAGGADRPRAVRGLLRALRPAGRAARRPMSFLDFAGL